MAQFSPKSAKAKAKVKGVTSRQAALAAALMKSKKVVPAKAKAMPMDAEDKLDGGVDEATEKK